MTKANDLTREEQAHVAVGLRFIHARCGDWTRTAQALGFKRSTVMNAAYNEKHISVVLAFRVARLAKVSVDDLLTGKFPPPNACPHCGHIREGEAP